MRPLVSFAHEHGIRTILNRVQGLGVSLILGVGLAAWLFNIFDAYRQANCSFWRLAQPEGPARVVELACQADMTWARVAELSAAVPAPAPEKTPTPPLSRRTWSAGGSSTHTGAAW